MQHNETMGPLLAFHSAHSIHAPLEVVPDAYDRFAFIQDDDQDHRRRYHAMVWNVDRAVGKIVDALKSKGMYEETLIVVSADK